MGVLSEIGSGLRAWLMQEHNNDGTHGAVTATSLKLQGSLVGVVSSLPYDAARFSSGAGTWTVTTTQMVQLIVARCGQMAYVRFFCDGSTLITSTTGNFYVALPELHALPVIGPTIVTGIIPADGSVWWNDRQHATTGTGVCGIQATAFAGAVPSTRLNMTASFPLSNDLVVSASCWVPLEANNAPHPFYGL